jgi:AcrR family transcriptional regulator
MSRKRLSRKATRDQTTERLLDATQKLIARKGLCAASVEDIATAAGYTRGAFYSNFSSKEDLFIHLLRRDHPTTHAELVSLGNDALSLDHIQQRTRDLFAQLYRDTGSFMTWTEARMLAARDTRFRPTLDALLAEKRGQITKFIEYFFERAGCKAPVPAATMATGLMALVEGVKLSMLSSPTDMTAGTAESVLTLFIDLIMHAARVHGTGSGAPSPAAVVFGAGGASGPDGAVQGV